MNQDKSFFRKKGISRREDLSESERLNLSHEIYSRVSRLPQWIASKNVLIYCSYLSEVDTAELIKLALEAGKRVFCPKVTNRETRSMDFYMITSEKDLNSGFHGIMEPASDEAYDPQRHKGSSVMIMPGTAFSRQRDRIGYNGGFYDKYLNSRAVSFNSEAVGDSAFHTADNMEDDFFHIIAVCFSCQVLADSLPCEIHDYRPDCVITEDAVY